ncbi:hypothetical protein OROMI_011152 [Orobanche minor]
MKLRLRALDPVRMKTQRKTSSELKVHFHPYKNFIFIDVDVSVTGIEAKDKIHMEKGITLDIQTLFYGGLELLDSGFF